ncbi:MAG: hypothetical protein U0169_13195 [Polyangiaceae bacterium]
MEGGNTRNARAWLVALILAFGGVVLVRNAWVGDDAYVTFRAVDNFVRGHGLRWNTAERVQAFTNPLWAMLLVPFYFVTREIYYTSTVLSLLLTTFAVGHVLLRHAKGRPAILFAGIALFTSKAFVDYGVGGLENPLSYALTTLFFARFLDGPDDSSRARRLTYALAALAAVNRLDAVLVLAPALVTMIHQGRTAPKRTWADLAIGFTPLLAWEIVATVYYGFPLPNTYYAKLHTGIGLAEYAGQGGLYFVNLASEDPVTLALLVAATVAIVLVRGAALRAVALGVLLHVLYVVRVGGDFMGGRFVANALLVAVIVLARVLEETSEATSWTLVAASAALGCLNPRSPVRTTESYEYRTHGINGIADEKGFYFKEHALIRQTRVEAAHEGRRHEIAIIDEAMIGRRGFDAGSNAHLVDPMALSDPFLARLPAKFDIEWRIGHFTRVIPPEYEASLRTGTNAFTDPRLHAAWDDVALVTRGPLFTRARWAAMWRLNVHGLSVDTSSFRFPAKMEPASAHTVAPADGDGVNDTMEFRIPPEGTIFTFDAPVHTPRLDVSLARDVRHVLVFIAGEREIGSRVLEVVPGTGMLTRTVLVPFGAGSEGFDKVYIAGLHGGRPALGHLRPADDTP